MPVNSRSHRTNSQRVFTSLYADVWSHGAHRAPGFKAS